MLTKNIWLDIVLIVLSSIHVCIMAWVMLGLWNHFN